MLVCRKDLHSVLIELNRTMDSVSKREGGVEEKREEGREGGRKREGCE